MRTLFTIHAGEYLVGSELEKRFKKYSVWIPSRDVGIDLLLANKSLKKSLSIQVKFSRDFSTEQKVEFHGKIVSRGWFTLNFQKLKNSQADIWVFVLYNFYKGDMNYIIIKPQELVKRYQKLKRKGKTIQSYFYVTSHGKCWEGRGLRRNDKVALANDIYENKTRDLTPFLNNWKSLKL